MQAFTLKGYRIEEARGHMPEENVMQNCVILETTLRAESNLDEQLHAGSYFYFPTSSRTFQSSSVYMYPILFCLLGFTVPISF